MYFDRALDSKARRTAERLGPRGIVVGLPTYKNSRTIGKVISALAEGATEHFSDTTALIVVADGGSTDDTIDVAESVELPDNVGRMVTQYQGVAGKGTAIRAVMEVAEIASAKACAVVAADLRSITSEWIDRLVRPVLEAEADFVTPRYTRDRHEVTINDMIGYPLTRALYGRDVRQPLGGEVAMASKAWKTFLGRDVWETDVARFGIQVWMTTLAINSGWQLYQAPLGTKKHDYKDPTVGFEPKFLQIVGTVFRMMSIYRRIWPEIDTVQPVPVWGEVEHLDPEPVPTTRQTLWQGFRKGVKRYRRNLKAILDDEQRVLLDELLSEERPDFPPEQWAQMVMDFGVVYNRGEGDPDKVALALLPMYYARKATMLRQLEGEPWTAVEEAIQEQAAVFEVTKSHLRERWAMRLPWQRSTV